MTILLRLFGFPPPERRDSVRFHFAKNLRYDIRISLALVLLAAGFAIQIYYMKALYGAPLLFIGICLVLVKGYDSRMRINGRQFRSKRSERSSSSARKTSNGTGTPWISPAGWAY